MSHYWTRFVNLDCGYVTQEGEIIKPMSNKQNDEFYEHQEEIMNEKNGRFIDETTKVFPTKSSRIADEFYNKGLNDMEVVMRQKFVESCEDTRNEWYKKAKELLFVDGYTGEVEKEKMAGLHAIDLLSNKYLNRFRNPKI